MLEVGPWGTFCLDGSHRIKALFDDGITEICTLLISTPAPIPPPADLIDLRDLVVSGCVADWRDRFVNFDESTFRPVARMFDQLSRELEEEIFRRTDR